MPLRLPRGFPLASAALCAFVGVRAQDMVILSREHADVLVVDRPSSEPRLGIALRDGDAGVLLDPRSAILEVGAEGRLEIPPGMEVFGPAGSSIWVLPASQDPALLYLGLAATGMSPGTWEPRFDIELIKVDGPGHFLVWQFDPFSGLEMRMNSRDGIGPSDALSPLLGGHEHWNWGFTAPGLHEVHLRVSGRLQGTTNVVRSDPVVLRFGVVPYTVPGRPGTLSSPAWDGTQLTCLLSGSASRTYQLEASADLKTWNPAGTARTDATGVAAVAVPGAGTVLFLRAWTTGQP